jgi:rhomboid protease GluP
MLGRKREGSVVCRSCGRLVGVNDQSCFNCGAWNPGLWGYAPLFQRLGHDLGFVQIVTGACAVLYVAMLVYDLPGIRTGGLSFLAPSPQAMVTFGASGAIPVFQFGLWWTVLSAGWLHGGVLHILFNMMWVRQLGPVTADVYGPSRLVLIYTVSSVVGFIFSSLAGSGLTLGASAALFGLFGALVWAGHKTGSSQLGRQALMYAAFLFVFGLIFPGVDNFAHAGGFVGGLFAGVILNPLKRETLGTLLAALLCLAFTALSVLATFVIVTTS